MTTRPTFEELRERRLNTMSANERDGSTLAARMSTSQAAVAPLEAGGTSATLATLHKAAAAID